MEDVDRIRAFRHPDFYAVDLNSKFEKSPGVKDMALVLKFVQLMRIELTNDQQDFTIE